MSVSAIHQHESVIGWWLICPLPPTSHPMPSLLIVKGESSFCIYFCVSLANFFLSYSNFINYFGLRSEKVFILVFILNHFRRNLKWLTPKLLLFNCWVGADSLQLMQHIRLLCPPLSPGVCLNSCLLSQWCYLTISSSATPFSFCLQSFPPSVSFPMS